MDLQTSLIKQLWLPLIYKRETQLLPLTLLHPLLPAVRGSEQLYLCKGIFLYFSGRIFWRKNSVRYSLLARNTSSGKKQSLFLQERYHMLVWLMFEQLIWNSPSLKNLGSSCPGSPRIVLHHKAVPAKMEHLDRFLQQCDHSVVISWFWCTKKTLSQFFIE